MAEFYGWTDDYMMSMDSDVFQDYWLAISIIEAEKTLNQFRITSYPHLKEETQKKTFNDIKKITQSIIFDKNERQLSTEEAAKKLAAAMLNG